EVVVAFLERRLLRSALHTAAAVDVQVREDAEQPGPEVRARLVLLPRAERSRVRVLHEVLGLLPRAGQPPCNAVDLVAQLQCLFFEADTITGLLRYPAGLGGSRSALAHPAATLATSCNDARREKIPAKQLRGIRRGRRPGGALPGR